MFKLMSRWRKNGGRHCRQAGGRHAPGSRSVEYLERRELLAGDLALSSFTADGTNLLISYSVLNENVAPFDVTVYRSSNGVALDAALATTRVAEATKRQAGASPTLTIAPSFTDPQGDYQLVVRLDSANEIIETDDGNNQAAFAGGAFVAADGTLHVHGSAAGDSISIAGGVSLGLTLNSTPYSYAFAAISGIHVRTHAGGDVLTVTAPLTKALVVHGGADADALQGGDASDYLGGGAGNDTVSGGYGDDTLDGGDGADALYGNDGGDLLEGGDGNDLLYAGYGDDVARGAAGDDSLYGSNGNDTLLGEDGNDSMLGEAGSDVLYSGLSSAAYGGYGGYGDVVDGGDGNDYLFGDGGADDLRGGEGNDTVYCGAADDVARGGYGDDVLHGGYGNDVLYGEDGNDVLYGEDGSDSLHGGNGNDACYGGSEADWIEGGAGTDSIFGGGEAGDIAEDKPVIRDLHMGTLGGNYWEISGRIEDDGIVGGRYVTLTGAYAGSIRVDSDGHFVAVLQLTTPPSGWLFADFTDDESIQADQAMRYVQ